MPDRFWVGNGSWDGSTTTNWSATSGGGGGASVPTVLDDVYFDASSGNCTISVTGFKVCRNLSFRGLSGTSNYTGTFTLTASSTVTIGTGVGNGNITLSPSMTFAPGSTGTFAGPSANGRVLTSNGKTFIGNLQLTNGNGFVTNFADNWTIQGNLISTSNPSALRTVGGVARTITVTGNCSSSLITGAITEIFLKLTGSLTGTGILGGTIDTCNIEIDAPGQTITQNALSLTGCNFTWTNGTYNSTAAITMSAISTFTNVSSINFHSFVGGGGGGANITLFSNMNILNNITVTNGSSSFGINGLFNFNVGGIVTLNTLGFSGTATIVMNGGTNALLRHASSGNGSIQNNLTINKSGAATVTVDPSLTTFTWGAAGRTLTAASSTQFNPGTSTVITPNNITVNISENMKFYNFNPGTTSTINII
jgi:hypothetical protein